MIDCPAVVIVDGDTLRCGSERVRLLGIDAADSSKSSRCDPYPRPGAWCDDAAYRQGKAALASSINGSVSIQPIKKDGYGRTVAVVYSGGANLSCEQLARGVAVYVRKWDDGRRVARDCPDLAR